MFLSLKFYPLFLYFVYKIILENNKSKEVIITLCLLNGKQLKILQILNMNQA